MAAACSGRSVRASSPSASGRPVGLPHLLDQHAPAREHLHQPGDDRVQQRVQFVVGGRTGFDEHRHAFGAAPVHPVQHQAMQVDVEVGRRPKTLDQRDGAAVGFVGLEPSLAEQMARDHAVHHLQHGRHQLGLCGQQQAQRDRQRQHPLAHRHTGDDVVHQVRRGLRHAPGTARGAKARALAAEGQQLVVAAVAAAQAQEAVGQDAAFQEGVELVLDELRQVGAGSVFGLGEEGRGVLLHQAVQRGLLRAVALVVDRGAITALSTPAQSRRLIKKTENAYPRPRDRRLSRKTRAAVGKPPGSTTAELAVSSADIPAAIAVPIGNQENTSTPLLLQSTGSWRSIGPVQFPHWLSQPG
jgi:hypothetical protein